MSSLVLRLLLGGGWIGMILGLLFLVFQVWMCVDAIRRKEWMWLAFMVIFPLLNTALYYFLVYRDQPTATRGFELPGAQDRKRIK